MKRRGHRFTRLRPVGAVLDQPELQFLVEKAQASDPQWRERLDPAYGSKAKPKGGYPGHKAREAKRKAKAREKNESPDFLQRAEELRSRFGGGQLGEAPGAPHLTVTGEDCAIIFQDVIRWHPECLPTPHVRRKDQVGAYGDTLVALPKSSVHPRIASLPAPARNLLYALVALSSFCEHPIRAIAGMSPKHGIHSRGNGAGQLAGALRSGRRPYTARRVRQALHAAHGVWLRWLRWTPGPFTCRRRRVDGSPYRTNGTTYRHGYAEGGIYLPAWVYQALRFDPNVDRLREALWKTLRKKNGAGARLRMYKFEKGEEVTARRNKRGIFSYGQAIAYSRLEREHPDFSKKLANAKEQATNPISHQKEPGTTYPAHKSNRRAAGAAPAAAQPISRSNSAPALLTPTGSAPNIDDDRRKSTKGGLRSHRAQKRLRKAAHLLAQQLLKREPTLSVVQAAIVRLRALAAAASQTAADREAAREASSIERLERARLTAIERRRAKPP
jgi:hypothetical protein